MDVVRALEELGTPSGNLNADSKPVIVDCGEVPAEGDEKA
jgi:hypothetical protein